MNDTIIYIGLDFDDTRYHGSAFSKHAGEVIDFQCRPTLKGLLVQLNKMARNFPECSLSLCYEKKRGSATFSFNVAFQPVGKDDEAPAHKHYVF